MFCRITKIMKYSPHKRKNKESVLSSNMQSVINTIVSFTSAVFSLILEVHFHKMKVSCCCRTQSKQKKKQIKQQKTHR